MCDRWKYQVSTRSCAAKPLFDRPLNPVSAYYSTGLNAYCNQSRDPSCNDPRNYKVSHGTWFIPIERRHELPIPPYPLFRAPNLFYTPQRSYLNVVANDPDNPFHYLAERDGIYT
jgi:hypothetical protein